MSSVSRVLMTGDSIGGVWTYCLDLSRALGELGVEVVLVTMGRKLTPEQHREAWSISTLTVHEENLKLEWMDDPWEDVDRAGDILLALEEQYQPDIVHLNGYAHGVLPFRAPVVLVAHSCVLSWWQAVHGTDAPAEFDTYRERVRAGLHAADSVVCITGSMRGFLEHHYGAVDARVIFNGCDPSAFAPDVKEDFVFSAGRFWDDAKNLAALARAGDAVRWPIYAAGDNQRPPGTSDAGQRLESGALHMLGRLSRAELAAWLGRASIYTLPARYEPFGLSALEAGVSGCALVLGDIPSQRELWEGAAIFVAPDDTDALADTLNRLIENRAQRERMAQAARTRALQFTLARTAEHYMHLYEELCARTPRKAAGRTRFGLHWGRERRHLP